MPRISRASGLIGCVGPHADRHHPLQPQRDGDEARHSLANNQCSFLQKGATYPEQNSIPNGVITP